MIEPAVTTVPSYTLTPRRWALESRPFLVEPAPLVFDTSASLALADAGDLDAVVLLAVPEATARVRLVLVGHAGDLRPLGLADHAGRHGRAADGGTGEHVVAVDQ